MLLNVSMLQSLVLKGCVLHTIKLKCVIPDILQERPAAIVSDHEASFLGFLKVDLQQNI